MNNREIVENFKNEMLAKLVKREDRYAPLGWQTLDLKRLVILLKAELQELEEHMVIDDRMRIGEGKSYRSLAQDNAVDIGNYAMFIHYLISSGKS